ncbi:MAG: hypothetical protein EOO03_17530 [Chitinophagaceae bacterium]|nr:MAG: hypothetical protein EOO03_17530 [Chitinophagaceae bacterium]
MDNYKAQIAYDLSFWKLKMVKKPSIFNAFTTKVQTKINSYIPTKVHKAITAMIKPLAKTVLFGSTYTTSALPAKGFPFAGFPSVSIRMIFPRLEFNCCAWCLVCRCARSPVDK